MTRNKKTYIPLTRHVIYGNSPILNCEYEGIHCLHKYIQTRVDQPKLCLNCMVELGVKEIYTRLPKKTEIDPIAERILELEQYTYIESYDII